MSLLTLLQEYGIAVVDKLTIGSKMCSALLEKVQCNIFQHFISSVSVVLRVLLVLISVLLYYANV
jgi:hypothetical protein